MVGDNSSRVVLLLCREGGIAAAAVGFWSSARCGVGEISWWKSLLLCLAGVGLYLGMEMRMRGFSGAADADSAVDEDDMVMNAPDRAMVIEE